MDTIWDEEKVNDKLENQSQSQISEIRCSHHALNIENSPLFLGMLDLSVYTNKKQRIRHTHTSHHATHFTMDVKWKQKGTKHFCPTTTLLPDRNYKKISLIFLFFDFLNFITIRTHEGIIHFKRKSKGQKQKYSCIQN